MQLVTGKQLETLINKLEKGTSVLVQMIDLSVRSAIYHHAVTGDVTPINRVAKITEGVVSNNAVRVFINLHGAVVWGGKEDGFKHSKERYKERVGAENAEVATPEQLETFKNKVINAVAYNIATKPEDDFKPLNVPGKLFAIIQAYEKMTDEERNDPRNNFALLSEVLALKGKAEEKRKAHTNAKDKTTKAPKSSAGTGTRTALVEHMNV